MKFKKLVTDIPENIAENTIIETDYNTGDPLIGFYSKETSKMLGSQANQCACGFATVSAIKDEYYSKKQEGFMCLFLAGYNTAEEARKGHKNIVEHVLKYGDKFLGLDYEEEIEAIARGEEISSEN